jgi:hypothetical protein
VSLLLLLKFYVWYVIGYSWGPQTIKKPLFHEENALQPNGSNLPNPTGSKEKAIGS